MNNKIRAFFENAIELRARIATRLEGMGAFQRKALESLALFLILGTIYSVYLKATWSVPSCTVVSFDLAYLLVVLKFLALTGWPFALLAFLDDTWCSQDAGRVFLGTFIAANTFWMHKYHHRFCPYSFAFDIFPYVFSAVVGNAIGTWSQTSRVTVEKYILQGSKP